MLLVACGPDIGELEEGEKGRVVATFSGDGLELDSGMRVLLAEIDAPRRDDAFANEAQAELDALTKEREVRLAYGGARRLPPRRAQTEDAPAEPQVEPQQETALAHVFVRSEGGRWFWLQHELVSRGAAFVRPRRDNHARAVQLLAAEAEARGAERGLWAERAYQPLTTRAASALAVETNVNCLRGDAPYRLIEARVSEADIFERRAALHLDGAPEGVDFTLVVFGNSFASWDGPSLASYEGQRIRARGALGVYREAPQMCVDTSAQIEILAE